MMAMSSTQVATWGNSSLTSAPDCPYLRNANGDGRTLSLILKTVVGGLNGRDCPLSFARRGFGSKVSIWDGPPSMNRKITDLALAAKWGDLGDRGLTPAAPAARLAASSPARASPPKPLAPRKSMPRRLTGRRIACPLRSPDIDELR